MGMTFDRSLEVIEYLKTQNPQLESLDIAVDTMRKYQCIQEIVKEWREVGLDYDSCDAMMNIERVIEE